MGKFILKSINREVTKKNVFQNLNDLNLLYSNRCYLNMQQLTYLKWDYITMEKFMTANANKRNAKVYRYYISKCKKAYETILNLMFKNL